ncbi:MAG: LamG domain-containing protein, partial [Polyangia bacterium]
LLQNVNDVTIATWVWVRTDQLWVRIFDFGGSTTKYMFLTPHAQGGGVRFAITTGGNGPGVEQQLNSPTPLPVGAWTHVAVVLQGTSNGTLYVNGTAVASSTSMPLRPSGLGATPNDWIGHSEFTDPNFDGQIDDFRIYARALTAADIQTIYTER